MENIEGLTAHIQGIEDLSEEEKNGFINQLRSGKNPEEVLDEVENKLQEKIDDIFDAQGITLDKNDPDYQAKFKEMATEIKSAESEFSQTMADIEKESNQLQNDTSKELDEAKLEEVRSKIVAEE
jgi:Zn-dependent oligopeptidase